jgi:hypothetical protein
MSLGLCPKAMGLTRQWAFLKWTFQSHKPKQTFPLYNLIAPRVLVQQQESE